MTVSTQNSTTQSPMLLPITKHDSSKYSPTISSVMLAGQLSKMFQKSVARMPLMKRSLNSTTSGTPSTRGENILISTKKRKKKAKIERNVVISISKTRQQEHSERKKNLLVSDNL